MPYDLNPGVITGKNGKLEDTMNKKITMMLALALTGLWVAGCGGGNANNGTGASTRVNGEVTSAFATTAANILAGQNVTFEFGGSQLTALAPFGLAAGDNFGVFRNGSTLLTASYANDDPQLEVFQGGFANSRESGASLGIECERDGSLIGNLALPPDVYTFQVKNATLIGSNVSLPIGTVRFTAEIFPSGRMGFPSRISGVIPGNGQLTTGTNVRMDFDNDEVNGRIATLRVIHQLGNVEMTTTVAGRRAEFMDTGTPDQLIQNPSLIEISILPVPQD